VSAPVRIATLGGGAWGTALASLAANNGHESMIYVRDPLIAAAINQRNENPRYLPGIGLHPGLRASTDPASVLAGATVVLAAIPAQAMRRALAEVAPLVPDGVPVVLCAKGIEQSTGRFMAEVAGDCLPGTPLAVLSGPSFATDVAAGLPTAVTLAAADPALAERLAHRLSGPAFRCYSTSDVIGVEVGGALKNVLAIAAGAAAGKGLGASAEAALITRGFVELRRVAQTLGAEPETVMGLSGLGDLMLTCSSPQSRNFSYGLAIGRGEALDHRPLAEGVATAPIAAALCEKRAINAPIIHAVADILAGRMTIAEAVRHLLDRPLKSETD
jgi:glycerol-3-phosphate dehydrogenase (NAD(P)+)